MTVYVKLFATLRDRFPDLAIGEPMPVELPEGATIAQLLDHLAIPGSEVKIMFVNHVVQNLDYELSGGDVVGAFPAVGGG